MKTMMMAVVMIDRAVVVVRLVVVDKDYDDNDDRDANGASIKVGNDGDRFCNRARVELIAQNW